MFALFFSLYLAMFSGTWPGLFTIGNMRDMLTPIGNGIGELLTSIFNNVDTPMTTLGSVFFNTFAINGYNFGNWMVLVSFVLALITSIGIVVMAVKGIKRVFSVFFMGVR